MRIASQKEVNTIGVILICAVIGIVFAMIVQTLNTQEILIPSLLGTTMTIEQLMFLIFFIWIIIGILFGVTLFLQPIIIIFSKI